MQTENEKLVKAKAALTKEADKLKRDISTNDVGRSGDLEAALSVRDKKIEDLERTKQNLQAQIESLSSVTGSDAEKARKAAELSEAFLEQRKAFLDQREIAFKRERDMLEEQLARGKEEIQSERDKLAR